MAAWLLVAFSLAMTATQGYAAMPVAVVVRVIGPAAPVQIGNSFDVTVQVEGIANLGAFEFDFGSNPAVANTAADAIHLGSFLGSTGRTTGELRLAASSTNSGRPLFAAYSYGLPEGPSGAGQLATVSMVATGVGVSSLDLGNLEVTNVSGVKVPAVGVSGTVEVSPPPRPLYLPLIRSS